MVHAILPIYSQSTPNLPLFHSNSQHNALIARVPPRVRPFATNRGGHPAQCAPQSHLEVAHAAGIAACANRPWSRVKFGVSCTSRWLLGSSPRGSPRGFPVAPTNVLMACSILVPRSSSRFEAQHALHALRRANVHNFISLMEGVDGTPGILTTNSSKEIMCVATNELLSSNRLCVSNRLLCTSTAPKEAFDQLLQEIRSFMIFVEESKSLFGSSRKTYTGKMGGHQVRTFLSVPTRRLELYSPTARLPDCPTARLPDCPTVCLQLRMIS